MIHRCLIAAVLLLSTPSYAWAGDPFAQAEALRREHRYEAAEQALGAVLRRSPDHREANLQMGALKQYLGDSKAALPYYQRAASTRPTDLEAQASLVHAFLAAGRLDEAERLAEKTIADWEDRNPDKAQMAKVLVGIAAVKGLRIKREGIWAALKHGLAVRSILEKAYAYDPEGVMPLYALARYHLEAPAVVGGDAKRGLEMLRRVIRRAPEDHAARAYLLQYLTDQGAISEARTELAAYRKAFEAVPGAMEAVRTLMAKLQ